MKHIPAGEPFLESVTPFNEALSEAMKPQAAYDIGRWLYVPPRYGEYRYILGTRGCNPLVCIGINPSTAAPDRLDPTLKSAERVAFSNGYDSFLMFNVYAQRATCPDDMEKTPTLSLHRENRAAFRYLLSLSERPRLWAAWGNLIDKRAYLRQCLRDFAEDAKTKNALWLSAGAPLKSGNPHHPLYLKSGTKLVPFDMESYLR